MKSAEQIEQSLRRLEVEASGESRELTRRDIIGAHARQKEKTAAFGQRSHARTVIKCRSLRIAAAVALALLLVGAFRPGTGSVALSQTHHAVSATLAWLKSMIAGGEIQAPPALPPAAGQERAPDRRAVACAARFFRVSADDQGVWQSLRGQGIELAAVSTDPEVYYATLSREQAESVDSTLTLECVSAPRVLTTEGDTAAVAVTNTQASGGLALGWRPEVSSDGKEVLSTISFHDGHRGFEIPNVSTEPGGVVLLRAKGMFSGLNQDSSYAEEVLIRLQMDIQ